jgi:hypothetical protein
MKRTVAVKLGVGLGDGEADRGAKAAPLRGGSRFVGLSIISAGAFFVFQREIMRCKSAFWLSSSSLSLDEASAAAGMLRALEERTERAVSISAMRQRRFSMVSNPRAVPLLLRSRLWCSYAIDPLRA